MAIRKVTSGQPWKPPTAAEHNAIALAADYHARHVALGEGKHGTSFPISTNKITIRNSSSSNRRSGEILQVDTKIIDTLDVDHLWLDGVAPTSTSAKAIGILRRPLPQTSVGEDYLQLSGVCLARINIRSTWHEFATLHENPADDDEACVLQSSSSGFVRIVDNPSESTGEQVCVAHLGMPFDVRPAITAEESDGYYPTQPYDELPVIFEDVRLVDGVNTYTDFSSDATQRVLSPFGWLPPSCRVDVVQQSGAWRIVRGPVELHGVASANISAAEWLEADVDDYLYPSDCGRYQLGSGTVHVWRRIAGEDGLYEPQYYSDDTAVTMTLYNQADQAVSANKFLTGNINADNEWIVTVEPCDGECED